MSDAALQNFDDAALAGVAETCLWTAAKRAQESTLDAHHRLFSDPFAALLAGNRGASMLAKVDAVLQHFDTGAPHYLAVRTRYIDDALRRHLAAFPACKQVVMPAAGMDTRAFRLGLDDTVCMYEIDRAEVITYKNKKLRGASAQSTCRRVTLSADLASSQWPVLLRDAGFDCDAPSLWVVEGLLPYLSATALQPFLSRISEMAAPMSGLIFDAISATMLESEQGKGILDVMRAQGAPILCGIDDPKVLLDNLGWAARVVSPSDMAFELGRISATDHAASAASTGFFVTATR